MKIVLKTLSIFILVLLNSIAKSQPCDLITYPIPADATVKRNTNFEVFVKTSCTQWRKIGVYDSEVLKRDTVLANGTLKMFTGHMGFVYFDFSGTVDICIVSKRVSVISSGIRPIGISRQLRGDSTFVTLTKPAKFSVEINGNKYNNLLVFANPIDPLQKVKKENRPKFHYFPKSDTAHRWTLNGQIQNGDTIYVSGGAVLRGTFQFDNLSNIKIMGRGIIDGSTNSFRYYQKEVVIVDDDNGTTREIRDTGLLRKRLMVFNNCNSVKMDGIIFLNSPSWNLSPVNCSNMTVNNIKILGYYYNTDGIDPVACKNLFINDVFIRSADDQISIKCRVAGTSNQGDTLSENITVKNSVFWPDKAHPIFVGPEAMDGSVFRNITFDSIAILECKQKSPAYYGCIAIGAADNATIKDVKFSNIKIERLTKGNIIDIRIATWGGTNFAVGRSVQNVIFKNIKYIGLVTPEQSRIMGNSATRKVSGVTINNFTLNGQLVTNTTNGNINTAFADNIQFNTGL